MKNIFYIALCCTILASCHTSEKINYFQDVAIGTPEKIATSGDIRLEPYDQIAIIVTTNNPQLNNLFNNVRIEKRVGRMNTLQSNQGEVSGYTLDKAGDIIFPQLGKLHVGGLTKSEVASMVKNGILEKQLAKKVVVTVEFMNLYFTTMGEVNKPGRQYILKDRTTILEGLAMSGDLTILGKRDAISVIREENGQRTIYTVDIRSKDIFNSPAYYLKQNDVVYVEPNSVRAGQSTLNQNSVLSTGFYLKLGSFLTALGTLLFK